MAAQHRLARAGPGRQDLLCWTQTLLLDGHLAVAEPKTLRYRLLHVAARIVHHARRTILRVHRTWPWALTWLVSHAMASETTAAGVTHLTDRADRRLHNPSSTPMNGRG
jgi:hypothetical protein